MSKWKKYIAKRVVEMRPYDPTENPKEFSTPHSSVFNGTPKLGDMIARSPKNHNEQWLVSQKYFEENFVEAPPSQESTENKPKKWWVPFHFSSNQYSGQIRNLDDWRKVVKVHAAKGREESELAILFNAKGASFIDMPRFGYGPQYNGPSLNEFFKANNLPKASD